MPKWLWNPLLIPPGVTFGAIFGPPGPNFGHPGDFLAYLGPPFGNFLQLLFLNIFVDFWGPQIWGRQHGDVALGTS